MNELGNKIVVTFNKEMLEDYTNHYFRANPRKKKAPLEWCGKKRNGQLVSWNRLINCPNRIMQNQWKQEFADYTTYVLKKQGIKPMMLEKCVILVQQYQATRTKSDSDNICCKPVLDAMVKYELLAEDNYNIVNPVTLLTDYDKDNPRTEFIIYPIDEHHTYEDVIQTVSKDILKNKIFQ